MRRCWNKSPDICPGCSNLHRLHTKRIIWSGINENSGQQETEVIVSGNYEYYFLTLTAPSFGKVHRVDKTSSNPTPCTCDKRQHASTDTCGSTPIDTTHYRYKEQVLWNFYSNSLWTRTQENLRRRYKKQIECAYIREPQKRGTVHYHVIVRVPKHFDQAKVMKELEQLRTQSLKVGNHVYKWGSQSKVDHVKTDSESVGKTVAYISKLVGYTTKAIGLVETIDSPEKQEFTRRLRRASNKIVCEKGGKCEGKNCSSKTHANIGFRGPQFGHTKGWSFTGETYSSLREEMRIHAEMMALAEGRDLNEPNHRMEAEANNHARRSWAEMKAIIGDEKLHSVDIDYLIDIQADLDSW